MSALRPPFHKKTELYRSHSAAGSSASSLRAKGTTYQRFSDRLFPLAVKSLRKADPITRAEERRDGNELDPEPKLYAVVDSVINNAPVSGQDLKSAVSPLSLISGQENRQCFEAGAGEGGKMADSRGGLGYVSPRDKFSLFRTASCRRGRPQNVVRPTRSLSTSPPPPQAPTSANQYTEGAGNRSYLNRGWSGYASRGAGGYHPSRTPLSATTSPDSGGSLYWRRQNFCSYGNNNVGSGSVVDEVNVASGGVDKISVESYLPIKLSQQQAEARNSVLNEIKALQLARQSSFRRILRLQPILRAAQAAATFSSSSNSNCQKIASTGKKDAFE